MNDIVRCDRKRSQNRCVGDRQAKPAKYCINYVLRCMQAIFRTTVKCRLRTLVIMYATTSTELSLTREFGCTDSLKTHNKRISTIVSRRRSRRLWRVNYVACSSLAYHSFEVGPANVSPWHRNRNQQLTFSSRVGSTRLVIHRKVKYKIRRCKWTTIFGR